MALLLTLLALTDALQYQPLDVYGRVSEECALILNGPGRSSLYDYTYNLLRAAV